VTFLFIGQVWANHHVMFDHIRVADRIVMLLNTLLLTVVAFLPSRPRSWPARCAGRRQADRRRLLRRQALLSDALDAAGATAIGRRFRLALGWLTTGVVLGLALPVLGVVVIAAFNAFYWLPIRGESPRPRA
jgi:hypothetical protein